MMKRLSIAEALRECIRQEMRRNERVFCIGEDIAVCGGWGGAFTVTLGLEAEFPDRMINTPIAENGFFGVALGAALMGLRPIADVQYADFALAANAKTEEERLAPYRRVRDEIRAFVETYTWE
jgi:pyruvate/2-oxoglutarate/acetoin dehydrogenase E1 component